MQHIYSAILEKLSPSQKEWFLIATEEITRAKDDTQFLFHFSSCSRKLKNSLPPFSCGLEIPFFNLIEITRIYLVLLYCNTSQKPFDEIFPKLKISADIQETVTLCKGLCFFPISENLKSYAEEGVRSNMKEIFESVAHNNKFPFLNFDENSWNQMVLKALFIDSPIFLIYGFKSRKNMELNRMVVDYALERIAASRTINPELWSCIIYTDHPRIMAYWLELLNHGSELEKNAICLIWSDPLYKKEKRIPDKFLKQIKLNTWEEIGRELDKKRKGAG